MTNQMMPVYYYPNKMGRIILQATEEILGRREIQTVLDLAGLPYLTHSYPPNNLDLQFPFSDVSKLQSSLETVFGSREGRGLALRSGRVFFKYGLREFGSEAGLTDLAFRLLPFAGKLHEGLQLIADTFNKLTDQRVRVEEEQDNFLWHVERCPVCWGRHAENPICDLSVGTLQEALFWIGAKQFYVQEVMCIAKGDPTCTFFIDKHPLD